MFLLFYWFHGLLTLSFTPPLHRLFTPPTLYTALHRLTPTFSGALPLPAGTAIFPPSAKTAAKQTGTGESKDGDTGTVTGVVAAVAGLSLDNKGAAVAMLDTLLDLFTGEWGKKHAQLDGVLRALRVASEDETVGADVRL